MSSKLEQLQELLEARATVMAAVEAVQFMAACRRAGERINPVLIDAAVLSYQAEESADLGLTFDASPDATLLQHTHFQQSRVPAPPKQPRVVKQVKSRTIVKREGESLDGGLSSMDLH